MDNTTKSPTITPASGLVIILTLVTAGIHFYLVPAEFDKGATGYGTAFILTGVAYLVALAAGFLSIPTLARVHTYGRVLIAVIAASAIVAYLSLGYFDTLGWVTKAIEAALIVAIGLSLSTGRTR